MCDCLMCDVLLRDTLVEDWAAGHTFTARECDAPTGARSFLVYLRRRAGLSAPSAGKRAAEAVARDAKQERIDFLEGLLLNAFCDKHIYDRPLIVADSFVLGVTSAIQCLRRRAGLDKQEPAKSPDFRQCPNCDAPTVDADGYCDRCQGFPLHLLGIKPAPAPTGECHQCGSPTWRKAKTPAPRLWWCPACHGIYEHREEACACGGGGLIEYRPILCVGDSAHFTPDQEDAP